jgi:cyclic beta-1,2-glucan synthetase
MLAAPENGGDPLAAAARALAQSHRLSKRRPRFVASWRKLEKLPNWLRSLRVAAANPDASSSKAAEWLLDNEYQIRRAGAAHRCQHF